MKRKILAVSLMACVLVLSAVTGTLAWLTDSTDPVDNIFTFGKVLISLNVSPLSEEIVPGDSASKTVSVTLLDGSVPAWVFVKVDLPDSYMITDAGSNPLVALDYNMTGWTLVDPDENVWGYDLTAEPNSTTSNLFSTISFSQALTEAQVAEMDGDPITVRAAGVQSEHIGSISEAWTAGFSGTFPTVP